MTTNVRWGLALAGFLAVAGVLLVTEHRAHAVGLLGEVLLVGISVVLLLFIVRDARANRRDPASRDPDGGRPRADR